jgi:hypothetical protein
VFVLIARRFAALEERGAEKIAAESPKAIQAS